MLDNIDKKLLYRLHLNARSPISQIARNTGLTREVVAYRMKKLEQEGVIKAYVAKINQSFFCEGIGTVLFKLAKFDEKRLQEILDFLKAHPAINWIAQLSGTADIVITLLYKNSEALANTLSEIIHFMGHNLKEHHLSLYITEYKFERQGIINFKSPEYPPEPVISFGEYEKQKITLDKQDILLLKELAKNCRIKNIELAERTGLSEDVVRLRIKKLEQKKVIFGHTITLDINKFGLEAYYLTLQIEQMTKEMIAKIAYYAHRNPYIGYCARTAGRYNLVISLYARNRQHFNELLLDMRKHFGTQLADYEFQLNLQEHKEIFVPENFIETNSGA
jgi:DNA-binding Lrp family transcriptional regulator